MVSKSHVIALIAVLMFGTAAYADVSYKMRYNPQTGRGDWVVDGASVDSAIYANSGWTHTGTNVALTTITDNVGIGTLLPRQKLEVDGIIYSQTGGIMFPDKSTQTTAAASTPPGGNTNSIQINKAGSFYGVDTFIYDIASGNVGIGTTNPARLLNVNGNALIGSATAPFAVDYKLQIVGTAHGLATMTNLPASAGDGLAFSVGVNGEGYVRTNFYSNGQIGFGPGSATRDVFIGRTAANTIGITGAYDGTGTGNFYVSGNVGVGTTTPVAKLTVVGTGSTTGTAFEIDNSLYAAKVTVLDNGNVGIGSTSPRVSLDVNGLVNIGTVTPSVYTSPASIRIAESKDSGSLIYIMNKHNLGSSQLFVTDDAAGHGGTFSYINPGVTAMDAVGITGNTVIVGAESQTNGLALYTNGDLPVRVIMNGVMSTYFQPVSGNVGIGTTTPAQKLQVAGTAQMTGFKMPTGAGAGYSLQSDANGVGSWQPSWVTSGANVYYSIGNVGIGSSTPVDELVVQGSYTPTININAVAGADAYTSQYPAGFTDNTYVKASNNFGASWIQAFACDPAKSLIGGWSGNGWNTPQNTSQRFHIDLSSSKVVTRIYYENAHTTGANTGAGMKNFTFWGSDSSTSFNELTYATNTGWTQLTTSQSTLDRHAALNAVDPKYITVTNSTAYRYYAFKFADIWDSVDAAGNAGLRRVELQTSNVITTSPAIKFAGNGTTLWTIGNDGADSNKFKIGTAELATGTVATISGSNIGMGTVTPTAKLTVVGTGSTTGTAFEIDDSLYAAKVVVLDNGNIGIGTTIPGAGLQLGAGTISGATSATSAHIQGNLEVDGSIYSSGLQGITATGTCTITTITNGLITGGSCI